MKAHMPALKWQIQKLWNNLQMLRGFENAMPNPINVPAGFYIQVGNDLDGIPFDKLDIEEQNAVEPLRVALLEELQKAINKNPDEKVDDKMSDLHAQLEKFVDSN